jgi:hypothetical protein
VSAQVLSYQRVPSLPLPAYLSVSPFLGSTSVHLFASFSGHCNPHLRDGLVQQGLPSYQISVFRYQPSLVVCHHLPCRYQLCSSSWTRHSFPASSRKFCWLLICAPLKSHRPVLVLDKQEIHGPSGVRGLHMAVDVHFRLDHSIRPVVLLGPRQHHHRRRVLELHSPQTTSRS